MSGQRLSVSVASTSARVAVALADAAEQHGVDGVWIGSMDGTDDPGDSFRTMVAAAVAGRTASVRIGCVLRLTGAGDELRLAEDVAMIDQASAGRLELLFALDDDPEREERAARLLASWRGWALTGGTAPVTPRPAQPSIPRLVAADSLTVPAAERLAAGVLIRVADANAAAIADPRRTLARRVVAFAVPSVRSLVSGRAAAAVGTMRQTADRCEADEVAIWLGAASEAAVDEEVALLAAVVGPGVAGSDASWEMLAELGARAAGVGAPA